MIELRGRGLIEMLLNVYLCGWLVTTIGALVATDRRRSRPLFVGLLAVLSGVLWPVLAVAVVELIAIVVVARGMRAASARQSDQAPMELDEVLI